MTREPRIASCKARAWAAAAVLLLVAPVAFAEDSKAAILARPRAERVQAIRDLLAAQAVHRRVLGAKLAQLTFETDAIDALETALSLENAPKATQALQESLDDLRVYRRIELPRAELPPLVAANGNAPADGLGPADLQVTVRDASGQPVGGALVLAYSLGDFLRWPFRHFAQADANGVVTLPLARGSWSVVAVSPPASGRGVFLVSRDVKLSKPNDALLLRPDAELAIGIEGDVDADTVHALDPAVGFVIAFPSLGRSARGRFVLETTKETPVHLLLAGRAKGDAHWFALERSVKAPAEVAIAPTSPDAARVSLRPPRHLERVDSARVHLRLREHDATPVVLETKPGATVFLPPGFLEIDYSVVANGLRYVYGPSLRETKRGKTSALVLDSPSRAVVFHEVRRRFAGERRVLTAGLLASDANGHFLLEVRAEGRRGRRAPAAVRVFRRGKLIAAAKDDARQPLFRPVQSGIEEAWLSTLEYEFDLDLGPGVPRRLPGVEPVPVESKHFTGLAPACLKQRLRRALEGAEVAYRTTCRLRGQKPQWKRTGIRFRPVLPPGVGASAGGQGLNFSAANLIKTRWLEVTGPWALPHELLHKFGFGHDDFMQVWQTTVLATARAELVGSPVRMLKPKLAETVLAMRRGQATQEAFKELPYLIAARHGLDPFRGYMDLEKAWKPKLQAQGLSEPESSCAILSEMAGADLSALYGAAGLPIRPEHLAKGRRALAKARPQAGPTRKRPQRSDAAKALDRALRAAKRKGRAGAEELSRKLGSIAQLPLDRQQVRYYLRFGKTLFELGALDEAHAALLEAQRAAARVGRAYLDLCRRMAVDLLQGKAVNLGHL
ncbi:MAG: carboxypeptidase-like regulatory domain-containing protein [Planctomycetota bacterium]